MFIFHCNDWRFKMFSNLEYSLFPYSYFFVFFPNAFVVCTQISVSRKLNRSTWSIWSLACSQALVWAKESAVQSGPTHNSLCLASLLQLNANETPYVALYESSDTMSDRTKYLQLLLMDTGVAGQIGEVAAKRAMMVSGNAFEGVTIPLPLMGGKIAKVTRGGKKCVFWRDVIWVSEKCLILNS